MRAALPGWRSGCSAALERRLRLERRVAAPRRRPSPGEAALDDPRDARRARPAARRPARYTRAISNSAIRSFPTSAFRRAASTRLGRSSRPEHGELDRDRLGQPQRVVSAPPATSDGVYVSAKPETDERVLDTPAERCSRVRRRTSRAARGSVNGTSSSRKRAISSTRSTSRVTSRARQVGTTTSPSRVSNPSRSSSACCSSGGISRPISSSARSGRSGRRAAPGARRARPRARPTRAPASSTISSVASSAACSARYGSTPFSQRFEPSVRSRSRSEVRKMPVGSKFAASSRTSVVASPISVSSPPMIPASAIGPLRVGDHEVRRLELALDAVERAELLARPRAGARRSCRRASVVEVEGVQRVAEREHHVVRHVDDVRDRPHAGRVQARPEPDRRRADRDVPEQPPDVARAALEILDRDRRPARRRPRSGSAPGRRRELEVVERRDLAGDPVDREQVRPVAGRLDEHDVVGERKHVRERRPRLAPRAAP